MQSNAIEMRSPEVSSMSISRARGLARDLVGETLEVVGGLAHGRDHDHDVVAGAPGAHDVLRDGTDAVGIGHRGATELLHEQTHDGQWYRRRRPILPRVSPSVDSPAVPKATKRERQRQNREARRQAMEEAAKRKRRTRTARNIALLLVPLVILFVILQLTNSDDSKSSSDITRRYDKAPAQTIDTSATYTATIDTSKGTIVAALDAANCPTSVNNFVFLARNKFYDGLLVNRVAKDFVVQTGSPNNTQAGGPGYTVKGEVPTATPAYPLGAIAFGNTGASPPGTAGSQFFIVTGAGNAGLSPDYACIGTVTSGLDVAQKISDLAPASGDGPPTEKVTIKKIAISSTPGSTTTTAAP